MWILGQNKFSHCNLQIGDNLPCEGSTSILRTFESFPNFSFVLILSVGPGV